MAHIVQTKAALSPQETLAALKASFAPEKNHSGKSRESFRFVHIGNRLRLVYATDRRSIFDMKLGFEIAGIGMVLNAFNLFSRFQMDEWGVLHDLVAFGQNIDGYLPKHLRGNPTLWSRAIVVQEIEVVRFEHITRRCLVGNGWTNYDPTTGMLLDQQLPKGLREGERLETAIYTPSTKEDGAHDVYVPVSRVREPYPDVPGRTLDLFGRLEGLYDRTSYFWLVDHKGEGGYDADGVWRWCDEVGTPDCSRIWRSTDYAQWPQKIPTGWDKQPLRDWGKQFGIDKLDPKSPLDQAKAKTFIAPEDVQYSLLQRYRFVFNQVFHYSVADFGETYLGMPPAKRMF